MTDNIDVVLHVSRHQRETRRVYEQAQSVANVAIASAAMMSSR